MNIVRKILLKKYSDILPFYKFYFKRDSMKLNDLKTLVDKPAYYVAMEINITPNHFSRIRNEKITDLSKDLQLKIDYFLLRNKEIIENRLETLKSKRLQHVWEVKVW